MSSKDFPTMESSSSWIGPKKLVAQRLTL